MCCRRKWKNWKSCVSLLLLMFSEGKSRHYQNQPCTHESKIFPMKSSQENDSDPSSCAKINMFLASKDICADIFRLVVISIYRNTRWSGVEWSALRHCYEKLSYISIPPPKCNRNRQTKTESQKETNNHFMTVYCKDEQKIRITESIKISVWTRYIIIVKRRQIA